MGELRESEAVTLRQVWADYKLIRQLKPKTVKGYGGLLCHNLGNWLDIPVTTITKQMVQDRYLQLSSTPSPWGSGKARANYVMRVLRALLSFAKHKYDGGDGQPLMTINPVESLSKLRMWHKVKRRRSMILPHQMSTWFRAVFSIKNKGGRDYLLLVLLTGLRKNEAARLTWDKVDFSAETIIIPDTKNGDEHTLPLPDFLLELLKERRKSATSQFVFPGMQAHRHQSEHTRPYEAVLRYLPFKFTTHDLRRTFVTVADSLDIPPQVIKRLVNHRTVDVTEGYIIHSVERLRHPMQLITDEILRQAGFDAKLSLNKII